MGQDRVCANYQSAVRRSGEIIPGGERALPGLTEGGWMAYGNPEGAPAHNRSGLVVPIIISVFVSWEKDPPAAAGGSDISKPGELEDQ